jgi:(p)ppGpp synthase/HD superfamily hydrolase
MSTLERALEIALQAHKGQRQKNGSPYVLHPLHLLHQVETDEQKIVAVLHDVVEDSEVTLDDLRAEGFTGSILGALDLLTRRDTDDYDVYIERIHHNELARTVKLADLKHNMDITRIEKLGDNDWLRLQKYHRIWKKLRNPPV